MSKCPGLHCDGCGKGGLTAGAVFVIIGAGVALANRQAIGQAATDTVHVIETMLLIGACLIASAVIGSVGYLAVRWRLRSRARTAALAPPATVPVRLVSVGPPAVSEPQKAAIEPARRSAASYVSPVSDSRVYRGGHD